MNTLDEALGGMKAVRQWHLFALTWDATAGKYRKQPAGLDGSAPIDASNPANWHSYTDALAALARFPTGQYALGFRFTAGCGYFLLDLDNCRQDEAGNLTSFAQGLVSRFPGALCEWSSSGRGVHVIGRVTMMPPHRKRIEGAELYSDGQSVAFGLSGYANGFADTVCDTAAAKLVADFFTPMVTDAATSGAAPEWYGPSDDNELISRMLNAKQSAAAAFGGKASLADLWSGKADKNSENDAALAAHLAFWTGKDAPRMERLMRRSGMVRDKWTTHRTYLVTTITNACGMCSAVYQAPKPPTLPTIEGRIKNVSDLMRMEFKPVQWAVRDILPEGVSILAAAPKLGKSWMVLQFCMAVAAGRPVWPPRDPEDGGDTLYIALEDNDRRMQRRIVKLGRAFPGANLDRFSYATEWPRGLLGVMAIREWLERHPEARMVVIDTVSAFRDTDPGRKSAYAHDYEVGEMLKPLTRDFNCAIILVAHTRKQGSDDALQKVSGTQGMTGSVDNVLVLERTRGGGDATLFVNGRDIEDETELTLRLDDGLWSYVGRTEDVERSKERKAILDALAANGGLGTVAEIHAVIEDGSSRAAVKMRLSRMAKAGEVKNLGSGLYSRPDLPEIPAPPPPPP